jgi:LPXTG-site transpeptidase (sortase) family protein
MSRDLLDTYERMWDKGLAWLNAPMSKRDLGRLVGLFRLGSRAVIHSIGTRKLAATAALILRAPALARARLGAIVVVAGSHAFKVCAAILHDVARRRALLLSRSVEPSGLSANGNAPRRLSRAFEIGAWVLAVGVFGYCSFVYANSSSQQTQARGLLNGKKGDLLLALPRFNPSAPSDNHDSGTDSKSQLLGFLDAPRIGLSSIVEEGAGPGILSQGVGDVTGTLLPGQNGNVGLAVRLDCYFEELLHLRVGDLLTFHSMTKTYDYSVVSSRVVDSVEEKTLPVSTQPILTLISYSPFQTQETSKQLVVVAREADSRQ